MTFAGSLRLGNQSEFYPQKTAGSTAYGSVVAEDELLGSFLDEVNSGGDPIGQIAIDFDPAGAVSGTGGAGEGKVARKISSAGHDARQGQRRAAERSHIRVVAQITVDRPGGGERAGTFLGEGEIRVIPAPRSALSCAANDPKEK